MKRRATLVRSVRAGRRPRRTPPLQRGGHPEVNTCRHLPKQNREDASRHGQLNSVIHPLQKYRLPSNSWDLFPTCSAASFPCDTYFASSTTTSGLSATGDCSYETDNVASSTMTTTAASTTRRQGQMSAGSDSRRLRWLVVKMPTSRGSLR